MVDKILVLHQGKVIQSGTYEELLTNDGPFAQFLRNYLLEDEVEVVFFLLHICTHNCIISHEICC